MRFLEGSQNKVAGNLFQFEQNHGIDLFEVVLHQNYKCFLAIFFSF